MRGLTYWAILAAIWLPAPAMAARFIPDCAGSVEIAQAHVVRVQKNGALILEDGRTVMLEGIRIPGADGVPQQLSDLALSTLRGMALAGPVAFTSVLPKEDRYGRIRAQAFGEQWFQSALLERGLARVQIAPDRNECAPDLYEAEQRGQAQRAGLWALPRMAPRAPDEMRRTAGSFQIVQGQVTHMGHSEGRVLIDFSGDGRQIFSAVIEPEDRRAFRGFDLDGLEAHHIRIRGMVQDWHGRPQIALSNPFQIEVLN
ncbi:MAG TPA: thermonuclease family protein [Rhizomicrobium sp.]|jgi:endonuclease YncB( thermonuclease family)